MVCYFTFSPDDDVTEATEDIFAQFDETNNQFDMVRILFLGGSPANFAMNEKTTGKLQIRNFSIWLLCADELTGTKLFTDNGLMNSKETLESLEITAIDNFCPYYSFAPNFLTGADKLNTVKLFGYNYDDQPLPESMPSMRLLSLESPNLSHLTPNNLPNMPSLQILQIDSSNVETLTAGILDKYPILEELYFSNGYLETVELGFFPSQHATYVYMPNNRIHSIDLSSLNPSNFSTIFVDLENNAITQLIEQNFRPFVESVLDTGLYNWGMINLLNNPLECSCDVKWLVSDVKGAHLFDAVCPDGTLLSNLDPEVINAQCPDV